MDDDASLHTDGPASLDLAPTRSALDEESLQGVARRARSDAREYLRSRGFVRGGELLDLDETYLAAAELSHAGEHLSRALATGEPTEAYFLSLLAGADDGERPEAIPEGVRWVRGLAAADAVSAYRRDVSRWLEERPGGAARPLLDRLRSHERRISALDGDVPTRESESLVAAARGIGRCLREGDDAALDLAADALDGIG